LTAEKPARLHHTTDNQAGITRHKARSGFDYHDPGGAAVTIRRHYSASSLW
jgi:hypothetical protein